MIEFSKFLPKFQSRKVAAAIALHRQVTLERNKQLAYEQTSHSKYQTNQMTQKPLTTKSIVVKRIAKRTMKTTMCQYSKERLELEPRRVRTTYSHTIPFFIKRTMKVSRKILTETDILINYFAIPGKSYGQTDFDQFLPKTVIWTTERSFRKTYDVRPQYHHNQRGEFLKF